MPREDHQVHHRNGFLSLRLATRNDQPERNMLGGGLPLPHGFISEKANEVWPSLACPRLTQPGLD